MYNLSATTDVYLYLDQGNPSQIFSEIELCQNINVIDMGYNAEHDITIDNLTVKYCGVHGIAATMKADGMEQNPTIYYR